MIRDWETTVGKCKDQPADVNVKKDAISDAKIDEEEEKKWLTEMERVEASVFDGKLLAKKSKTNKEIAAELFDRADRRVGKNTTVMVDGYAISKESMSCGDWEAVPTFAGKDPRLAEPKRAKKVAVEPQGHCQVCFDGGDLHCCNLCPRAYHYRCLDQEFKGKAKLPQFNCPQHGCYDCQQKTTDAGGMLYRCRWCERAYCEDCLDWEKTLLVGNNLIEYEILGYGAREQAFYIQCHACTNHFAEHPNDRKLCERFESDFKADHERLFGGNREMSTRAGSLTDATTIDTPGVITPVAIDDDDVEVFTPKKRKLQNDSLGSFRKRERLV